MRRTGKTLAMVRALDERGAVIVAHSGPSRQYIERMVRVVRPDIMDRVKVVTISHQSYMRALDGVMAPIWIDHAVHDALPLGSLHREICARADAANARWPTYPRPF